MTILAGWATATSASPHTSVTASPVAYLPRFGGIDKQMSRSRCEVDAAPVWHHP
jgi:hypothetical protein